MTQPLQTRRVKEALARVRNLFLDPGAKLTTADAAQMAGLDREVCRALLQNLVEAGFLEQPRAAESSAKTDVVTRVTAAAISRRAYGLFQAHGGEHGHDVEDWLLAEAELREGHNTNPADQGHKSHL